jgi:hypothetical protein
VAFRRAATHEAAHRADAPRTDEVLGAAQRARPGRAIACLHYNNTFARTPDVKYVVSHVGYLAVPGCCDQLSQPRPTDSSFFDVQSHVNTDVVSCKKVPKPASDSLP